MYTDRLQANIIKLHITHCMSIYYSLHYEKMYPAYMKYVTMFLVIFLWEYKK